MRGGIPIQGDHPRSSMLFRRMGKEPLGGDHITPFAQEKIDGVALFIHGAVEVNPLAFDLEVSLIHAPRVTHRSGVRLPTLFKIRHVAPHPPQDRLMSQQDAALGHHLDQVTGTKLESQVPSHTQNDDLLVKVPSLEQILCRGRFRQPGSYGRIPTISTVCTRTVWTALLLYVLMRFLCVISTWNHSFTRLFTLP